MKKKPMDFKKSTNLFKTNENNRKISEKVKQPLKVGIVK